MNEQDFIRQEMARQELALKLDLKQVQRKGTIGRDKLETLLINNYVQLSPPRPGFPYNHYKLTKQAEDFLSRTK